MHRIATALAVLTSLMTTAALVPAAAQALTGSGVGDPSAKATKKKKKKGKTNPHRSTGIAYFFSPGASVYFFTESPSPNGGGTGNPYTLASSVTHKTLSGNWQITVGTLGADCTGTAFGVTDTGSVITSGLKTMSTGGPETTLLTYGPFTITMTCKTGSLGKQADIFFKTTESHSQYTSP